MNKWYLEFMYDDDGKGTLLLNEGNIPALSLNARTGRQDVDGEFVNKIKVGIWYINAKAVTMKTANGQRKLFHLLTPGKKRWSTNYYLTSWGVPLDCIASVRIELKHGDCEKMFDNINKILETQEEIEFYINIPIPREVRNGISG